MSSATSIVPIAWPAKVTSGPAVTAVSRPEREVSRQEIALAVASAIDWAVASARASA